MRLSRQSHSPRTGLASCKVTSQLMNDSPVGESSHPTAMPRSLIVAALVNGVTGRVATTDGTSRAQITPGPGSSVVPCTGRSSTASQLKPGLGYSMVATAAGSRTVSGRGGSGTCRAGAVVPLRGCAAVQLDDALATIRPSWLMPRGHDRRPAARLDHLGRHHQRRDGHHRQDLDGEPAPGEPVVGTESLVEGGLDEVPGEAAHRPAVEEAVVPRPPPDRVGMGDASVDGEQRVAVRAQPCTPPSTTNS